MVYATRGDVRLQEASDLKAHLASMLRLENVGVLLGAGASVPAGGQTITQAWQQFLTQSKDSANWLEQNGFIDASHLQEGDEGQAPNLEDLIDALTIALTEWKRAGSELLEAGSKVHQDLYRALVKASVLNENWWRWKTLKDDDAASLKCHRTLIQKLSASRQPGQGAPWIFTTNYDLAVEWAAESIGISVSNGFLGTHRRQFSPQSFDLGFRNLHARGEARFGVYNIYLAKLHGSLTWVNDSEQLIEIPAPFSRKLIHTFLEGESDELGLMVLPSAAKYLQTTGFILGELLRRFSEFLSRSQTCLFVSGYSFGDEHINRLLLGALLNPTLQMVIYFPEFDPEHSIDSFPATLQNILSVNSPRVTVVGGGSSAFFDEFIAHLPEPAFFDDSLAEYAHRISQADNDRNLDEE